MSDDLAEAVRRFSTPGQGRESPYFRDNEYGGALDFALVMSDLSDLAKAYIATLTAPTPVDWQPIETAPKDRIRVIGAHGDFVLGDIYFGEAAILLCRGNDTEYVKERMEKVWRYSRGGDKVADRHQPTHWQPLPDASRLSRPKPQ